MASSSRLRTSDEVTENKVAPKRRASRALGVTSTTEEKEEVPGLVPDPGLADSSLDSRAGGKLFTDGGGGGRGCRAGGSAEVTEAPAMKPAATAATAVLLAPARSGAFPSTPLDFPEELCFPLLPFCIQIVDRKEPAVARPSEVGSSGAA